MKYELKLLGFQLLGVVIALAMSGLLVVIVFIGLPTWLDVRAGRVALVSAGPQIALGIGAGLGIVAMMLALLWLKSVILVLRQEAKLARREQAAAKRAASRRSTPAVQPRDAVRSEFSRDSVTYPTYWPELRQLVLDRDGHRCGNCGSREQLQVHHIVPLSRGGTNEPGNLRTLCVACHGRLHPSMQR